MRLDDIDPTLPPSGDGCADCDAVGGWWVHLRRCAVCGDVRCCDTSPAQHATAHARASGHPVAQSFEPGEEWFWDYERGQAMTGPTLAPPIHRPLDQPVPGPAGRVPADAPPERVQQALAAWVGRRPPDRILGIRVLPSSPYFPTDDFQRYNAWQGRILDELGADRRWRQADVRRFPESGLEVLVFVPAALG